MKRAMAVSIVLTFAHVFPAAGEEQRVALNTSALAAPGDLQTFREPLSQVFQFKLDGDRLNVDRAGWDRAAKRIDDGKPDDNGAFGLPAAFAGDPKIAQQMQIQSQIHKLMMQEDGPRPVMMTLFDGLKAKGGFGGGSGRSDDRWTSSFYRADLTGEANATQRHAELKIEETGGAKRTLQFTVDDNSSWRIQMANTKGDLLILRQGAGGRFSLMALVGDATLADQAESFMAFYKRHQPLMDTDVLPLLAKFGFSPALTTEAEQQRKAAIAAEMAKTHYAASLHPVALKAGSGKEVEDLAARLRKSLNSALELQDPKENPVCCLRIEITNFKPNPGHTGYVLITQPGGAVLLASDADQLRIAIQAIEAACIREDDQVYLPLGLSTNYDLTPAK